MTIKTQGGKVILKNRKVSCECCEECCMYPADALADALYSENDLPDNVIVDGTLFSRSGTNYGNAINGVIFEENVWAKYRNGIRSQRNCLIQSGVVDQFADTYTVTACAYPPVVGATVTRVSLCTWQGTYIDTLGPSGNSEQGVSIIYCPGDFIGCGSGTFFENPQGIEIPYFYAAIGTDGSGGFFAKKTPYANTPSGTYNFEPTLGGIISFA